MKTIEQSLLQVPLAIINSWITQYDQFLTANTKEGTPRMLINSQGLVANNYHDESGRGSYMATQSGTSESQLMSIRSACYAYEATKDITWYNRALFLANALIPILYRGTAPSGDLWCAHWLFDVKGAYPSENYYLNSSFTFNDGICTIPAGSPNYGDLIRLVWNARTLTSTLVWPNPFSDVNGTSYNIADFTTDLTTGTTVTLTDLTVNGSLYVVYCAGTGADIEENQAHEAWPVWRFLEPAEIDSAGDSQAWALDTFNLLYEMTGNVLWQQCLNATMATIPNVYNITDSDSFVEATIASSSALDAAGSYIYSTSSPAASVTRNPLTGYVQINVPLQSGSTETDYGVGGMTQSWVADSSISASISSTIPMRLFAYIDETSTYNPAQRYMMSCYLTGSGLQEITWQQSDIVTIQNLFWSPQWSMGSSPGSTFTDPNSSVVVNIVNSSNPAYAAITLNQGTDYTYPTPTTADPDPAPIPYAGYAQFAPTPTQAWPSIIPPIAYSLSGPCNLRVTDSAGWVWYMALPSAASFTVGTFSWSEFTIYPYYNPNGTPPTGLTPATGSIQEVLFDAQAEGVELNLYYVGSISTIPTGLNYTTFAVQDVTASAHTVTIDYIKPMPQPVIPYIPYAAPFTVNILSGSIVQWRGMPYAGYQNPFIWQMLNIPAGVTTQLQFLTDAQAAYTASTGVTGPFAPCFLWDRWDTLQYGAANTWTWNGSDPNTLWGGFQYRALEATARALYNDPSLTQAKTIVMSFLTFISNYWTSPSNVIITDFPEGTTPTSASGDEPHMASLLLRACIYAYLSGATGIDTQLCLTLINRCLLYLQRLFIPISTVPFSTTLVEGTWSPVPAGNEWYGFWGSEIIQSLSMLINNAPTITTDSMSTFPRTITALVEFDMVDVGAQSNCTPTSNSIAGIGGVAQATDGMTQTRKYMCEENNWTLLDGSFYTPPKPTDNVVNDSIGWWSAVISDLNGNFATPYPTLTLTLSRPFTSLGLTFVFSPLTGDYCNLIQIVTTDNMSKQNTYTVHPTSADYFWSQQLTDIVNVVVTFYSTNNPYRRVHTVEVLFGEQFLWTGQNLFDLDILEELDPLGNSAPPKEVHASIANSLNNFNLYLGNLQNKQPLKPYLSLLLSNGTLMTVPMGTFYLYNWLGDDNYLSSTLYARDMLDIADGTTFYASTYTGSPITLYNLAVSVIQDFETQADLKVNYQIDTALQNINTSGVLPVISHHDALMYIAQAGMAVVYVDRYNTLTIKRSVSQQPLNSTSSIQELPLTMQETYPKIAIQDAYNYFTLNIYSNTGAATAGNIYSGNVTVNGTISTWVAYTTPATPTSCVATLTGGTLVSAVYYANAANLTITGAGSVGISISGLAITSTSIQQIVNNSGTQPSNEVDLDNPLVTDATVATNILNWYAAECQNVYLYEVESWMDFSWENGDVIYWDSQYYTAQKLAKIIRQEFRFSGTLSGTINGKGW